MSFVCFCECFACLKSNEGSQVLKIFFIRVNKERVSEAFDCLQIDTEFYW